MIVVQQEYSKEYVLDLMRRLGYRELADEASRELPDPVDAYQLEAWCFQHGLPWDEVMSRMGGSP